MVLERCSNPASPDRQEIATSLMWQIDRALKDAAWDKKDLCGLVVGQGPGSFTGIRCAVVTARTLAQALELPLISVCRLEGYALRTIGKTAVVISAGSQLFFMSGYKNGTGGSEEGAEGCPRSVTKDAKGDKPGALREAPALKNDIIDALIMTPCCVNFFELTQKLHSFPQVLADEASSKLLAQAGIDTVALPLIKNIAIPQAEIAWSRINSADKNLPVPELAKQYAWENVKPLYLRRPSITPVKQKS